MNNKLNGCTVDSVINAYSGRPGCACGCQGKWHETQGQKTRILHRLQTAISQDPKVVRIEPSSLDTSVTVVSAYLGTREYILHINGDWR
jgi:hypothetical protein